MDWLMKYSECKDTGLRVCEVYEHLLVREDGMVRNVNPSKRVSNVKGWHAGNREPKGRNADYRAVRIPTINKMKKVHQLVALAFIDNPLGYIEVHHIDICESNNHVNNLAWCDRRTNCSNQLQHKTKLLGTCYDKSRDKWIASIRINNKNKYIGRYSTEQLAHNAYVQYKKDNGIT